MMTTEQRLREMLLNIKAHQRPKESLLNFYIEERLNKSLQVYYKQLTQSLDALQTYDEANVLKKLVKTNID